MNCSRSEIMVTTAAKELNDGETVFVGIGKPTLASNLAKSTHAPDLNLVYEAGILGSPIPKGGTPITIADPKQVSGSAGIFPIFEFFSRYLQGGRIDVGFLGGAQVDRWGNINSTAIGDYNDPTVRLPGSGGACDIANNAGRIIIVVPHEQRRFPEEVDYVTSPGHIDADHDRDDLGLQGGGPSAVITDKAVMRFDDGGEMYVESLLPDTTREEVQEATGWEIPFASDLNVTSRPNEDELEILRTDLDPKRVYIDVPEE